MAREDIDYKEYSRLRDIAHKRVVRMEKAGYDVNIQLPTVKQVRASENPYWFLREMQKFVEGATTLGAVRATGSPTLPAEIRPHFPTVKEIQPETELQKKQRKRDQARRSRQRRAVKNVAPDKKQGKFLGYLKAAQTIAQQWIILGEKENNLTYLQNAKFILNMTASEAAAFAQYAEYRFSQGDFTEKYAILNFAEDFANANLQGKKVTNLQKDFDIWLSNQEVYKAHAKDTDETGIPADTMLELWQKFVGE